ncbi:MAG: gamma-glutamyl-gamma-aminobutyrate hydrolase family protein [Kiritimatiellae bacterium]|nr:gamma-glutamyl-gamma-aminobutyrate hydrolase family protein [Kiritimatiellia bacterium]
MFVGISELCQTKGKVRNVSVRTNYAESVAKGGHLPVILSRYGSDDQLEEILSRLDLLLLPGGGDISPARYGGTQAPALVRVNLLRDSFEWRLLTLAEKRRLPVVGICRGCQVLNVFHGGTLWQDLPSEFPVQEIQHRGGTHHPISIAAGARLARMISSTSVMVNSSHHQAVKTPAPGFRIVATSPDGVVEAIESEDYPALGVQFHPEVMVAKEHDTSLLKFFQNLPLL